MMFTPILVSMTRVKAGRLKALGVTSPPEFSDFVLREVQKYAMAAKEAGIKAD